MAEFFNSLVSSHGEADFGGDFLPGYGEAHIVTQGPDIRYPTEGVGDFVLRACWFSLGFDLGDPPDTHGIWLPPVYVNFVWSFWGQDQLIGAVAFQVTKVRWSCTRGTEVQLRFTT